MSMTFKTFYGKIILSSNRCGLKILKCNYEEHHELTGCFFILL